MVICTVFVSAGQLLWKSGTAQLDFASPVSFLNLPFLLGFASYGVGAGLMLLAFRDGELSILYPIIASSYVWVSIASPLLFPSDSMNLLKWGGVILILVSVSLLGLGSSKTEEVVPLD